MSYRISTSNIVTFTLTGVDATATGATLIDTTESGRFVPIFINLEATNVVGFTSVPSVSIGSNSPNFDDLLAITALTDVDTTNETTSPPLVSPYISHPSSTGLSINVTTAAVATTYTLRVTLVGIYY